MAIKTKQIGSAAGGLVQILISYDDAKNILTNLRVINNSDAPCYAEAVQVSNGRKYSSTFLANTDTNIAIPTGASQKLAITFTPNGKIDGVEYGIVWPSA